MSSSLALEIQTALDAPSADFRSITGELRAELGNDIAHEMDLYFGEVAGAWAAHIAGVWNSRENQLSSLLHVEESQRRNKKFAWRIQRVVETLNPSIIASELETLLQPEAVKSIIQNEAQSLANLNHIGPWIRPSLLSDEHAHVLAKIVLAPSSPLGQGLHRHSLEFSNYLSTLKSASSWGKFGQYLGVAASVFGAIVGGAIGGSLGSRAGSRIAGQTVGSLFDQTQKVLNAETRLTEAFGTWANESEALAGFLGQRLHLLMMAYLGSLLVLIKRQATIGGREIGNVDPRTSRIEIHLSPKEKDAFSQWYSAVHSTITSFLADQNGKAAYEASDRAIQVMKADPAWVCLRPHEEDGVVQPRPAPFLELVHLRAMASVQASQLDAGGSVALLHDAAMGEDLIWSIKNEQIQLGQPALIYSWLTNSQATNGTEFIDLVRDFFIRNHYRRELTFRTWSGESMDPNWALLLGIIYEFRNHPLDQDDCDVLTYWGSRKGFKVVKRILANQSPKPSLIACWRFKRALRSVSHDASSEVHHKFTEFFKNAVLRSVLTILLLCSVLTAITIYRSTILEKLTATEAPTYATTTPQPPTPVTAVTPPQDPAPTPATSDLLLPGESRVQAAHRYLEEAIQTRDEAISGLGDSASSTPPSPESIRKRLDFLVEEKGDPKVALAILLTEMTEDLIERLNEWKEQNSDEIPEAVREAGQRFIGLKEKVLPL